MSTDNTRIIIEGDRIKYIVNMLDDPKKIILLRSLTSRIINGDKSLTENEILYFMIAALGYAVKNAVPESLYDNFRLIINTKGDDKRLGCNSTFVEGDKLIFCSEFFNYNAFRSGNFVGVFSGLTTFGHELCHTYQNYRSFSGEDGLYNFLSSIEIALSAVSDEFYTKMYNNLYFESEAELVGSFVASEFFKFVINAGNKQNTLDDNTFDELADEFMEFSKPNIDMFYDEKFLFTYINILIDKVEESEIMDRSNPCCLADFYVILNNFFDSDGKFSSFKTIQYIVENPDLSDSDDIMFRKVLSDVLSYRIENKRLVKENNGDAKK